MRKLALAFGIVAALVAGIVLWLRPMTSGPPHFVLSHSVEFEASPEEVWAAFTDFGSADYAEWNPYLKELTGALEVGEEIGITIVQDTWEDPLQLRPRLTAVDPPWLLAWRGDLTPKGLMQTDHSFHVEVTKPGFVRFTQREEFRGKLAEFFDDATKADTRKAFRVMDEALAERVAKLRQGQAR